MRGGISGFAGNGEVLKYDASVIITTPTEDDVFVTSSLTCMNSVTYPDLTFVKNFDGILSFDEETGTFEFLNSGYLVMNATLNFEADVASANLIMVPEFNFGSGWVVGLPRIKALTAIRADQFLWNGEREIKRGDKARFNFAAESGNICFRTQIIDEAGPLEALLPAAIFYVSVARKYSNLIST